jgi:hypothetical protein
MRTRQDEGGWAGWIVFAAIMMLLVGGFNVLEGLVALFQKGYFVVRPSGLLVWNYTAWGWIWIGIGSLQVTGGLAVLSGRMWGRILAVALAGINALGQLAFLAAYPVWSILIIALDVIVIYALTAHGRALD